MAPEEGFEPPTRRLTAACSAPELLRNRRAIMGSRAAESSAGSAPMPSPRLRPQLLTGGFHFKMRAAFSK